MRPVGWIGRSREEIREFPEDARRHAGQELSRVQRGLEPFDWKPIRSIGPGVSEIRVRDSSGEYRVVYVAKYAEAIYVLHCFHKTTQKAEQHTIELARRRFRQLIQERVHG
ncbi:type II toxin-antitoxin system RelE/ParE family toxin [Taklimakanibacter deserti]|uniref:type II toxin-antitoxin system RelE/ParE family toxin n=1 Tax=Taklimakanibacter deserti TaxID=2267839 RepID=UPI000E64D19D